MRYVGRWRGRIAVLAISALVIVTAMFAVAPPAPAQTSGAQGSIITRSDCEAGRITRRGVRLSRQECLRLVGQRVRLANSGFDAWIVVAGGVMLLGGAAVLYRRRRTLGMRLQA